MTEHLEIRERLAEEFLDAKRFADSTAKRAEELKKVLIEDTIANGHPDERGHVWCPAGKYQLKRELRVSDTFDSQAAAVWAKENGHWDDVKETIEVLNEDRLLALAWNSEEIAKIVKSFYGTKEVWAFKVVEGKSYDDE
jgi:hypothetical protein